MDILYFLFINKLSSNNFMTGMNILVVSG